VLKFSPIDLNFSPARLKLRKSEGSFVLSSHYVTENEFMIS